MQRELRSRSSKIRLPPRMRELVRVEEKEAYDVLLSLCMCACSSTPTLHHRCATPSSCTGTQMVRAHNVVATCNGSARCSDSLLMMIPHCTVYIIHDFLTAKELEYIDQLATENANIRSPE